MTEHPSAGPPTARERLLRVLKHQKTDRLPICPVGLSPFTWQTEFPAYGPVLEVAGRHCEFMVNYPLNSGLGLCDPGVLPMEKSREEQGERRIDATILHTPKGELRQVRIHDRSVGSWATAEAFVNTAEDLERRESLPFRATPVRLDGLPDLRERTGEAGLVYCNGISSAVLTATWGLGEEFRLLFCHTEPERLRVLVERAQERLYDYVSRLLQAGAGPVFRLYSIEDFTVPMMRPSFVDEFIVPYDREIVRLIHDHGRHVVMHCHGRLAAQIERMLEIGVDGVDCVESPPQNDIDLRGMVEKAEGRMFIWGYVQFEDLARRRGDEIEEMVRQAVEIGGTGGSYVLSQAASPWSAEISPRTQENWIRMIEAGARYGGHGAGV